MGSKFREYNQHKEIIEEISQYERWKEQIVEGSVRDDTYGNIVKFLHYYKDECSGTWADFISKYRFAKHAAEINEIRYVYQILPNTYDIMSPHQNDEISTLPGEMKINYDFRNQVIFRNSSQILMLDYDYADGFTVEKIVSKLDNVVRQARKFNVELVFLIFPSDRGVHAYLISHKYEKNLIWVDFLKLLCNDAHYTAFSYEIGFNTRLNKKREYPDDDVIWVSPLAAKNSDTEIDKDFPTISFPSEYFNRVLDLKIPKLSEVRIFGNINYINMELLQYPFIDYMLSQYMKNVVDSEKLEKEIYDQFIYPNISHIEALRSDILQIIEYGVRVTPIK